MTKLYNEYKASLKDTSVEEAVDLYLFRPIAFVLVKMIYRFPITPNQISLLSIFAGIAAGIFFAYGDKKSFLYAGLLYALAHILDCMDGMIARLKKNGTLIGRIIDGWADYVTSTAIYVGLLIGINRSSFELPAPPLLLLVIAGFSLALNAMVVDYYRHEFMAHALGKTNTVRDDLKLFSDELDRLKKKKGKYLEKLMIAVFLGYTKIQVKNGVEKIKYSQEQYYKSNRPLLFMWNWIGLTTHIFVLILAAFLYDPMIFFYYNIAVANVWMLIVGVIQIRTNKKIAIIK
jgi:phosphatidylglycerophosphate synthase